MAARCPKAPPRTSSSCETPDPAPGRPPVSSHLRAGWIGLTDREYWTELSRLQAASLRETKARPPAQPSRKGGIPCEASQHLRRPDLAGPGANPRSPITPRTGYRDRSRSGASRGFRRRSGGAASWPTYRAARGRLDSPWSSRRTGAEPGNAGAGGQLGSGISPRKTRSRHGSGGPNRERAWHSGGRPSGARMSTRIHRDGYRMPMMSLTALQTWTTDVRAEIQRAESELYHRLLGQTAARIVDRTVFLTSRLEVQAALGSLHPEGACDWTCSVLHIAAEICVAHQQKPGRSTLPSHFDLGAEICLLPSNPWIYVLLFTEHEVYHDILRGRPGITPYPYRDNADWTSTASAADWSQRGAAWASVLGPNGIPAENGFTAKLTTNLFLPETSLVSHLPSREERMQDALTLLGPQAFSETEETSAKIPASSLLTTYRTWRRGEAGEAWAKGAASELERRLPEITDDTLKLAPKELFARFHEK